MLSLAVTLFPQLPQASLQDLLRLMLLLGLIAAPFVFVDQRRRHRVRRFMDQVRRRDEGES